MSWHFDVECEALFSFSPVQDKIDVEVKSTSINSVIAERFE